MQRHRKDAADGGRHVENAKDFLVGGHCCGSESRAPAFGQHARKKTSVVRKRCRRYRSATAVHNIVGLRALRHLEAGVLPKCKDTERMLPMAADTSKMPRIPWLADIAAARRAALRHLGNTPEKRRRLFESGVAAIRSATAVDDIVG